MQIHGNEIKTKFIRKTGTLSVACMCTLLRDAPFDFKVVVEVLGGMILKKKEQYHSLLSRKKEKKKKRKERKRKRKTLTHLYVQEIMH